MRSDMSRVVIERPRVHGYDDSNERRFELFDHLRQQQGRAYFELDHDLLDQTTSRRSMSRGRWGTKHLTDLLGPLVGYLRKNVGRPWDKVNSDIHEHLKMTSMAQGHILDHIDHMVEKNVQLIREGKMEWPYDSEGREIYVWNDKHRTHHGFYVCPKSGLLKLSPIKSYKQQPRKPAIVKIGKRMFKEDKDIWFELILSKLPERKYNKSLADVLGHKEAFKQWRENGFRGTHPNYRSVTYTYVEDVFFGTNAYDIDRWRAYGNKDVYCSEKKQLNGREIDKLGLRKKPSQLPNLVRRRKKKK